MPKAEKGSTKDIANRMKAKGLQKLKFYCQMCNKQCRDQNGFKCHLTSDSHLRNMTSFCSNASGMLDTFSAEFESFFLDTLYRRHRTKKMNANHVYQEVIQDKEHVHMNATKWATLTDFIQYLGKVGKCVVDETERGWYITFIERDPTILAQQENYKRRVEAEKREELKFQKRMEVQRTQAAKLMDRAGFGVLVEASVLQRKEDDAPIALKLGGGSSSHNNNSNGSGGNGNIKKKKKKRSIKSLFGGDADGNDDEEEDGFENENMEATLLAQVNKPISDIKREIMDNEIAMAKKRKIEDADNSRKKLSKSMINDKSLRNKDNKDNKDNNSSSSSDIEKHDIVDVRKKHWIRKNILARIVSKKVKRGRFYKRKCVINSVYDKYTAEVEILDSGPNANDGGDILEIDQDDLETVIPKVGKKVMILNGKGRGMVAKLISAEEEKFRGKLSLLDCDLILRKVDFNDFSKVV